MESLKLGVGYKIDSDRTKVSPIELTPDERKRHMWCFGTTGVGKTKLIESILEQDIPAGKNVVFIDPKGDGGIFNKIVQLARDSGRMKDLMLFTPIFPEYSVHFNPLKHFYMLEEQVGHIVSGIAAGKDPFFQNVAYEISLALVMTDHLLRYGHLNDIKLSPFSLVSVLNEMSHKKIYDLIKKVEEYGTADAIQLAANLQKISDSGQDYYNKVSSSLRVALMEECNGNIGQVIGKTIENPLIDRLECGKSSIFVVQLGSLLTRKAAYTVGKVILSSLQAFIGRTLASGKVIEPALSVHIDEAQSALYQGVDELFAKSGSANVYLHGYCQSISQMYSTVQKDYAHSILDNCNTKIFMRVTDSFTSDFISKHFGFKNILSPIVSTDGSITLRDGEIERVKSEDIIKLQARKFYMITYSGMYYGKTVDVLPNNLKIIFPDSKSKVGSSG